MEKERLFSSSCFLNLNLEQSMDQNSDLNSALSSIVSSPSNNPLNTATDTAVIGELIGRLGSICNSGEISPQSHHYLIGGNDTNNNSTNKSCYSTPLNSPQKLNLSAMEHHHHAQPNLPVPGNVSLPPPAHLASLAVDPEFTERAARFSCFGAVGLPRATVGPHMGISEIPIQGGPQIDIEMKSYFNNVASHDKTLDNGQLRSISEEPLRLGEMVVTRSNSRKRKTTQRGRTKEEIPKVSQQESLSTKRTKSSETGKNDNNLKGEKSSSASSGRSGEKEENNQNPSEPPKQDYIHVRARRGQATDSHSLAERVRREKISERMKFLQDLVPGCNRVTGKAVMLDEIINYVQSLQRQVEFLSMKLATVNPLLDFNMENLFDKDIHQSHGSLPLAFPPDNLTQMSAFVSQPSSNASMMTSGVETQCGVNSLDSTLKRSLPLDGFGDPSSQLGTFWNDELSHVFQMGYGQNQDFSSTTLQGTIPTTHMKVEM